MSLYLAICSEYDEQGTYFIQLIKKALRPAQGIILYLHYYNIVVSLQLDINFDSDYNHIILWK